MGAGIPGTGMATLFYLVSAVVMPLRELVLTLQGRSSWARWRLVCRHVLFASAMAGSVVATFRYLPRAVLPPDVTIGGVSSLLVTAVLFVVYLVVANLAALLLPGRLQLPQPAVVDLRDREEVARPVPVAATVLPGPRAPDDETADPAESLEPAA
jgi:hypothetical protein